MRRVFNLLGLEVEPHGMDAPPGHASLAARSERLPDHYEVGFEEWLIVLVGRPVLRTPDGEELRPWDVAFFPNGEEGAHKVTNRTGAHARVAMLSNKTQLKRTGLVATRPVVRPRVPRVRLVHRRLVSASS